MFDIALFLDEFTKMTPIIVTGHLSYTLVAVAMLMRDIVFLRGIACLAAICNITFAAFAKAEPNVVVIFW